MVYITLRLTFRKEIKMKNYANYRFDLIEDDDLVDKSSDTDTMSLCFGFIAGCIVMGVCFWLEFIK